MLQYAYAFKESYIFHITEISLALFATYVLCLLWKRYLCICHPRPLSPRLTTYSSPLRLEHKREIVAQVPAAILCVRLDYDLNTFVLIATSLAGRVRYLCRHICRLSCKLPVYKVIVYGCGDNTLVSHEQWVLIFRNMWRLGTCCKTLTRHE